MSLQQLSVIGYQIGAMPLEVATAIPVQSLGQHGEGVTLVLPNGPEKFYKYGMN